MLIPKEKTNHVKKAESAGKKKPYGREAMHKERNSKLVTKAEKNGEKIARVLIAFFFFYGKINNYR